MEALQWLLTKCLKKQMEYFWSMSYSCNGSENKRDCSRQSGLSFLDKEWGLIDMLVYDCNTKISSCNWECTRNQNSLVSTFSITRLFSSLNVLLDNVWKRFGELFYWLSGWLHCLWIASSEIAALRWVKRDPYMQYALTYSYFIV